MKDGRNTMEGRKEGRIGERKEGRNGGRIYTYSARKENNGTKQWNKAMKRNNGNGTNGRSRRKNTFLPSLTSVRPSFFSSLSPFLPLWSFLPSVRPSLPSFS
jgi:hypothetical protein